MSTATLNNEDTEFKIQQRSTIENIDPFVDEGLNGTLDSSGGSSELQAAHLQASTVTFTGVPSPQPSDLIPAKEDSSELPTIGATSKSVDNGSMQYYRVNTKN